LGCELRDKGFWFFFGAKKLALPRAEVPSRLIDFQKRPFSAFEAHTDAKSYTAFGSGAFRASSISTSEKSTIGTRRNGSTSGERIEYLSATDINLVELTTKLTDASRIQAFGWTSKRTVA
jgi:hypothetical protein